MKISKKLVSFMLALAMMVTAMAVQTVPVQAKSKAKGITGTGCAGELTGKKCGIRLYNISNSKDYEALKNFETMSNKEIYTYYEVTKKDVKQTKVSHSETDAGYVLTISTPNGKDNFTDCVIKDKKTGSLYELEYTGTENPYTIYKSVQVM